MLIKNIKQVASISYSAWAFYILAGLIVIPDLLYTMFSLDLNPVVIGRLILLTILFGLIGRFLEQGEKNKTRRRIIIGFILLTVCSLSAPALAHISCQDADDNEISITSELVKRWEGEHKINGWHTGYLDTIAEPDLPTACYGHTETALVGKRYTQEQCDSLLAADLVTYRDGIRDAFTQTTINYRITPRRGAAYTSFTYNVGIRAASKSTSVRRLNRGDIEGACDALTWWNKSGGRVVRGLVNRRNAEFEYCIGEL